jgi:ABC-2 type transport system ATP-binding protein
VLDPTAGVDVELRRASGVRPQAEPRRPTVVLTTHYLEEAEALCTPIAMLKQEGSLPD